jgi:putative two-component system hydrogenase maturation factor HypX/HoxX
VQVIVLMGGRDHWSNGIHLQQIEAAESPADESWANINAIDDLAERSGTDGQLTIAAMQGNCGAGGCFMARAADLVWARAAWSSTRTIATWATSTDRSTGPTCCRHGSASRRQAIMQQRLPMSASAGVTIGLRRRLPGRRPEPPFASTSRAARANWQAAPDLAERLQAKRARRQADELQRPLASYRAAELAEMERNFYGFDPSYHIARYHFVHKTPHSWTPRHLAIHREPGWSVAQ